jgi:hypothetical protein
MKKKSGFVLPKTKCASFFGGNINFSLFSINLPVNIDHFEASERKKVFFFCQ